MQCLVAAARPLQVKELAEIMAFEFNAVGIPMLNLGWRWEDQEEAVMSACSSLVMIVKDGDSQVVQFSHFSVKEFLTADRLAEPIKDVSRYHIRLEAAHTILVRACLGVLLRLDDLIDRDEIKNFPLARYAAQYWATHARFENASSHVKDGMECLFDADKPHFATWLWIYNEDGSEDPISTQHPKKPDTVPLYYAARLGFRDLVEHLITQHPEHVNAQGGNEETPLHAAVCGENVDILSLLLEHGADVDGRSMSGNTALHRASRSRRSENLEAGKCLLDHGADINARNVGGYIPLIYAAYGENVEFARMLLERGARTIDHDDSGQTSLHWAVRGGRIQAVRLILEHGADVNARNNAGKTPFQYAEQQEISQLLLEYGANSV